ncbi:MAG: N-6 DNA methylase, partial [Bacteroidales bacterium]|nr:N-6 DNA methylase [Bacteroidales bacterium]
PKSNPFLRKLFGYIAGPDIDERIMRTVDNLADVFRATNVEQLLKNFGKTTQTHDPIIHFYETFLAEYDPKLRKARGVWYTPEPVVNFIVRAVDDILKTEFDLPQGLADTAKTKIKVPIQGSKKMQEKEVHKVQILDPATGTGTFLAEVVKFIYSKRFKAMQGAWSGYVDEHLIPRLNGFELLMASYSMAHLKLDMLLRDTGYKATKNQRFNIYLTNSLEEYHPDTGTLFSNWLSTEANEANHIKRDTPVMCVIGNPPYSGESANKGDWIMNLMEDYKKEPGGKEKLKERNPKWINDDYVKFLRYGQHYIEKNGSGVLAFINPHGFLDNPTFRGMRWNLLKTYDKIYTLDLHGNSKKKEISPDGTSDENVFDIMQGVSINILVKTGEKRKNELGNVFHYDLWGKRENKYQFLWKNTINSIPYTNLPNKSPMFYMVTKDYEIEEKYLSGFSLNDLFIKSTIGVQTHRDDLVVDINKNNLIYRFNDIFASENLDFIKTKYGIKESKHWQLNSVIEKEKTFNSNEVRELIYRPFDKRFIYYNDSFVDRTRRSVGGEVVEGNLVLNMPKIVKVNWNHTLITKAIPTAISMDINGTYFTPLYIYPDDNGQQTIQQSKERISNLNQEIVKQIADKLSLTYTNEKESTKNTFAPIDILDYIYAVLHSRIYREKYNEFLKTDFPRVPYPNDQDTFWQLVKLGGEIRQIHLLETPKVEEYITGYPVDGDNTITTKIGKKDWEITDKENGLGRIWINSEQYFENIPLSAWEFYIGGYQPAQKWLKDRKERTLNFDDILHYQKIIVALYETDRLMKEIDN